jgi:hypothetical protein
MLTLPLYLTTATSWPGARVGRWTFPQMPQDER